MKQKKTLIQSLVNIEFEAKAYFAKRKMQNPVVIDVEYAKPSIAIGDAAYLGQNAGLPDRIFGAIYKKDAAIWVHRDLAQITLRAAELLFKQHGWHLKIMDSLRVIEAQAAMQAVAKANGWSEDYVSAPGGGAHPRAMAIDIVPIDANTAALIAMGSYFDHFESLSNRDFTNFSSDAEVNARILSNRKALDEAMLQAAEEMQMKDQLYLLPSEWWDYRFTEEIWSQYPPLSDADLPKEMQLMP